MTPLQVRKRLLKRNPFASVAAGDPWEDRLTDVPSINQVAFAGVMRLLRQIGKAPREPLAALVLGEVGNGKSHLIARLRQACQQPDRSCAFAWISPPESGSEPYRYLLREIADGLRHQEEGLKGVNTWHCLAAAIIVEGVYPKASGRERQERLRQVLRKIGKGEGDPERWWKKVRNGSSLERMPHLWQGVVEILVRKMTGTLAERREAAAWLRGDVLEPDHLSRMRFDRSDFSREDLEEEARMVLVSLGQLLARYRKPLLVCFDRMEDLSHPAQNAAMDRMLTFLVDRMDATLPVAFFRGQFWGELRAQHWNAQTVGRLESNRFEMTGCSGEEALELVRCRLRAVLGQEGMEGLFFDDATLLERLAPGRNSPRVVITLANRRLQELLELPPARPVDPETRLAGEWEVLVRKIRARMHDEPARPQRLTQVLRLYLFGEVVAAPEQDAGAIETPGSAEHPARLWLVETVFHPKAMLMSFKQGLQWLESHPDGVVTYVRDGRFLIPPTPKWPETNRMLHLFQVQGGRLLGLSPERVARWHAIGELYDAIRAGEITWVDESGREMAMPVGALVDFLRTRFAQGQHE